MIATAQMELARGFHARTVVRVLVKLGLNWGDAAEEA